MLYVISRCFSIIHGIIIVAQPDHIISNGNSSIIHYICVLYYAVVVVVSRLSLSLL